MKPLPLSQASMHYAMCVDRGWQAGWWGWWTAIRVESCLSAKGINIRAWVFSAVNLNIYLAIHVKNSFPTTPKQFPHGPCSKTSTRPKQPRSFSFSNLSWVSNWPSTLSLTKLPIRHDNAIHLRPMSPTVRYLNNRPSRPKHPLKRTQYKFAVEHDMG